MANQRLCSIEGCGKKHFGKGLCNKHYRRLHFNGDVNAVKSPRGDAQEYYETVVLKYEEDVCLIWPFAKTKAGYGKVVRKGKVGHVSRFLCEDTYGPPPTPIHEAAHSCGRGHEACVTKGHLSWKTPAQNAADKFIHGTHNRGEKHVSSKLKEENVREIISLKGIETQRSLADRFGVRQQTISRIQTGKRWEWMT